MANELTIDFVTGATLYALLFDATGQVWNGSAFEAVASANWLNYDIAMSEVATATGVYLGTMPAAAAGVYGWTVRKQAGGSPAVSDITVGTGRIEWSGTAEIMPAQAGDQMDLVDAPNATAAAAIAAAGWAYTPRTLTQTAAAVASVMAGTSLTITRGDTLSATLTGLGNITGYANLWFTVKWATSDLDAAAIIQIDTDTGLLTVNGAAATAGNGSITVDDATAGDITIALEASVTDDLTPATGLVYDVQWQSGTSIYTLTGGAAVVSADVTRAVA